MRGSDETSEANTDAGNDNGSDSSDELVIDFDGRCLPLFTFSVVNDPFDFSNPTMKVFGSHL